MVVVTAVVNTRFLGANVPTHTWEVPHTRTDLGDLGPEGSVKRVDQSACLGYGSCVNGSQSPTVPILRSVSKLLCCLCG